MSRQLLDSANNWLLIETDDHDVSTSAITCSSNIADFYYIYFWPNTVFCRDGTGSLGRRVNGSFGSFFQSGSPGPRVIIMTRCATRCFILKHRFVVYLMFVEYFSFSTANLSPVVYFTLYRTHTN